jgi:uncharacterized coiled-coil DUF342 family protein
MLIAENENFKREYREFSEKISLIADPQKKLEMSDLLNKLVSYVSLIDGFHQKIVTEKNNIDTLRDLRDNLKSVRKQLFTGLGI